MHHPASQAAVDPSDLDASNGHGILDQFLMHHMGQVDLAAKPLAKASKTPDLIRRRRNYLQRKRMIDQKNSIESMQRTVRDLEARYEALCAAAQTAKPLQGQQSRQQDQDEITMYQLVQQASTGDNYLSLHGLVREVHRLIHENARLRELIEQQVHFQYVLRSIVQEAQLERTISLVSRFRQSGNFFYVPFTMDQCRVMIRTVLAQQAAKRPDFESRVINKQLPWGWRGCICYDNATKFRFQFTKEFPGTPESNSQMMWKYVTSEIDTKHVYFEDHHMEILQHVSDDIKIARRRVSWQGWTCWSVFLMYLTRCEGSYLFGCMPLPLWGSVVKADGKVYTRICRWGTIECEAPIFMPLFQQTAVECILRYEHLVVFPMVTNVNPSAGKHKQEEQTPALIEDIGAWICQSFSDLETI